MTLESFLSDQDCHELLVQLDENFDVNPTDWECEFIESNLKRKYFTPKQKAVIQKLADKYNLK